MDGIVDSKCTHRAAWATGPVSKVVAKPFFSPANKANTYFMLCIKALSGGTHE